MSASDLPSTPRRRYDTKAVTFRCILPERSFPLRNLARLYCAAVDDCVELSTIHYRKETFGLHI